MIKYYKKGFLVLIKNDHYGFRKKNDFYCDLEEIDFVDKKVNLVSTIKKWFKS